MDSGKTEEAGIHSRDSSGDRGGYLPQPPPSVVAGTKEKEIPFSDSGMYLLQLPAPVVVGPDDDGVKKETTYRYNEHGKMVRVVTTTQRKKNRSGERIRKAAAERRTWPKFGDAANGDDASARRTILSTDEVFLQRAGEQGSVSGAARGVYKPPRRFATTDTPRLAGNLASLRVSNLTEEADALDVQILFRVFGRLRGVSVGKGFATVHFQNKDDAAKAMARVDGHGYGNLILRVQWLTQP